MSKSAPVSMTAFATRRGQGTEALAQTSWVWEIRSVNGKGLDLRLRLPEGIEGLEVAVRAELTKRLQRGNVSVGLRLNRGATPEGVRLNPVVLASNLAAMAQINAAAEAAGLALATASAADILSLRGVTEPATSDDSTAPVLLAALMADFTQALTEFDAMRQSEGRALGEILSAQIDGIESLTSAARAAADARRPKVAESLQEAMARVLGSVDADPTRIAQELALLAVKADITEETDRLQAHVAAARALLGEAGAIGRKFDFLAQEFNREANTLCSKSGDIALTRIGLDLKHLIDQMREQVQNLE